ncbi:MAG: phosphatidylserine/phosphatidylglycerophosphate/cardiolipin synthase family protein, partial [Planctomycetota bacterium]|nr:phosphatidylserine/phosphatidylglycerophosphate/cardiolipin synthase family protein [Planctomycetota bacterium]
MFVRAESAKLLIDGERAFPEMLGAIADAKVSVDLETYILVADGTGRRFAQALIEAARRGVQARLLIDAVGSIGLPSAFVDELLAAGVRVGIYHPLLVLRPDWAINRRDHRKILIVDRRVSFTGGLNLSDDYAPKSLGGRAWRDTHARLDGARPAAALLSLFEFAWEKAHHQEPGGPKHRTIRQMVGAMISGRERVLSVTDGFAGGGVLMRVIGNREFRQRRRIRATYLHAIRQAREYILIENAFFLPDRGIRRALAKAVKRGVRVAVAVSRVSDPKIGAVAGRVLYSDLLAAGVRIFEWPEPMLHAKTAVVDGAWAVVGSYNINSRSLFHDLEAVVVLADPEFAGALRDQTLADLRRCHEVTQDEHEARPWSQMLLESASYLLRYWI